MELVRLYCPRQFYIVSVLLLIAVTFSCEQDKGQVIIEAYLSFNKEYKQSMMVSVIDFERDNELREIYDYPFYVQGGYAPGDVPVFIETLSEKEGTYLVRIDGDRTGDYNLLEPMKIKEGSEIEFSVKRTWNQDREKFLPYRIIYMQRFTHDGDLKRLFYWVPGYRAEGTIQYNDNKYIVGVLDIDGDGIIDDRDLRRGSIISIVAMNGEKYGRGQSFFYYQHIPLLDKHYILDTLYTNATYIRFREVEITTPKIGTKIPEFTFEATTGETFSSRDLRGRNYILHFWASWCMPCIAKFPLLSELDREYPETLELLSVNVDYHDRLEVARIISEEHNLTGPQMMTGEGYTNQLFRLFTSMEDIHPVIPLYVFINQNGVIEFAGNNFERLANMIHNYY